MLNIFTDFVASQNLLFMASKTKCMYFNDTISQLQSTVEFMGRSIEYVDSTELLCTYVCTSNSRDIIVINFQTFHCRVNNVLYDFKDIPCDFTSKLLDT